MQKVTLAVLFAVASALGAQTPYLVEDINSTTTASPTSSSPRNFARFGPRVYFAAFTSNTGEELWSTDGTEAGTSMVANIVPGTLGSLPSRFTVLNGILLFNASDQYGEELWTTDGTAAGTRRIADIYTLSQSSAPGDRAVIDGKMIFAATDAVNGRELWITDGTPAGTRFFKDLAPGPESSSPRAFAQFNGAFYFGTATGLWKTDGTEAGTVLVKAGVALNSLTVAGPRIFFYGYSEDAGREPWVSDGTTGGTHRIVEINPGPEGVALFGEVMTPLGNRVLFGAYEPEHGSELWVSDGTAAGTQILRDVNPGSESGLVSSGGVVSNGAVALFAAHAPESGTEIWRTDGTPAGTTLLREFNPGPGSGSMGNLITAGSSFVFTTSTPVSTHFWTSDGTAAGTRETATVTSRLLFGSRLTNIDGTLYFAAADSLHGYEPWKSDGTAAGTSMFANIGRDAAPSSEPGSFRVAGDWLYFNAWDGLASDASDRNSFWRSDGTPEGTVKISEEILGGETQVAIGRTLFFQRNYSELWMTGGTPESTKRATELEKRFPQPPSLRFVLGDRILANSGQQLWATTLTPGAPAVPLGSAGGSGFVEVAGRAFYLTNDSGTSVLWSTDGTPEGTYVVRRFPDGISGAPAAVGGHVYFVTAGSTPAVWRSDGTADGTVAIPGLPIRAGGGLVPAGSQLYCFDSAGTLWVTDGTTAGTRQLPAKPLERYAVTLGNSILFHQTVGTTHELWISDGTPEGTHELYDFGQGATTTYVVGYLNAGGQVFFNAYTPALGRELWVTDGTAAGTKLVADVEPGSLSSSPQSLHRAGERIFFAASTAAVGQELWAMPLGLTPRLTIGDVRVAEAETTARFAVSLSSAAAQTVTVAFSTGNGTASGTASGGSDYDAASGTLTFAAGETSKTIDVRVHADASAENDETFLVALREPSGATIETAAAAGIIEDDDRTADAGLALDFSQLRSREVGVLLVNAGPGTATNLQPRFTSTPESYGTDTCERCRFLSLAPGETAVALRRQPVGQQYFTATVSAREHDPNAANDSVAWTMNGSMVMEGLDLAPGSQAKIWIATYFPPSLSLSLESSDPAVLTVPSSVDVSGTPVSFTVHGIAPGTATIRAFTAANTLETLVVHVVAPGTPRRWPGGMWTSMNAQQLQFSSQVVFKIFTTATAPFNGRTATGTVTLNENGVELSRLTLKPEWGPQGQIAAHVPRLGKSTFTVEYSGDANFLPFSQTHDVEGVRGRVTLEATAVRKGSGVVVRARVTGSPMGGPEGTIRIGDGENVPLASIGPGIAAAEVTLPDVPESTTTLTVSYSGDPRYLGSQQGVRITDERRRTVRH
jgi:ELWxxDGT repeat protein